MGQANCCHQKADKDLFVGEYLQKDKFREVEGDNVDETVAPAIERFRNEQGIPIFIQVSTILRRSMVHKNGGKTMIRRSTISVTGIMQK